MSEHPRYGASHGRMSSVKSTFRPSSSKAIRRNYPEDRLCENCGITFPAKRKDAKTCSARCSGALYRKKYVPPAPRKFCARPLCTNKTVGNRYKYCSSECIKAVRAEKDKIDYVSPTKKQMMSDKFIEQERILAPIHRITTIGANSSPDAMAELINLMKPKGFVRPLATIHHHYPELNQHKLLGPNS